MRLFPAHQELEREVVDALGGVLVVGVVGAGADPELHQAVTHCQGDADVGLPLAVHVLRQLAERELQVAQDPLLEGLCVHSLLEGGELVPPRFWTAPTERALRG
jgi:hypothetical protein